jgi:solute carrier family 31 (copper transporter), member 1
MGTETGSMPMSTSADMTSSMNMNGMDVVFYTSTTTPLWSSAFAPQSTGQYAGICIFLIAFATVFRMLVAVRVNFHQAMATAEANRNGLPLPRVAHDAESDYEKLPHRPWKAKEAVSLGALDLSIAGVSYLL